MKRLQRTSLLLSVFILGALSCFAQTGKPSDEPPPPPAVEYDPKAWKEFSSPEGGFSVLLVGTPHVATMEVESEPDNLSYKTFGLQTGVGMYLIMYNDLSIYSENPKLINMGLDAQRDTMLRKSVDMKLLSEKEITFNGMPAREWLLQQGDSIIRQRAILVKERMYFIGFVTNPRVAFKTGRPSADPSEWTDFYRATGSKFLDSFKTLPRKPSTTARLVKPSEENMRMDGVPKGPKAVETEGEVDRLLKDKSLVVIGPTSESLGQQPPIAANQIISGGVLEAKALSKPQPVYPPIAKAARAQGTVVVKVVLDEEGKVMAAQVESGHPLLQAAALKAAREVRFAPTLLDGKPVKVAGVIAYNFVLQ